MNIKEPTKSSSKGFTLIELLIVVAIIGILAAVGLAVIPGLLGGAKKNATIANHENLAKLMEANILKGAMGMEIYLTSNSSGSQYLMYCCPINASNERSRYITHLRWEGWKNPYDTKEEAAAENCNSKPGCIEIGAQTEIKAPNNLSHHTLKTYYLDENDNLKTREQLIKVE